MCIACSIKIKAYDFDTVFKSLLLIQIPHKAKGVIIRTTIMHKKNVHSSSVEK